jgi:predicted kinase
MLSIFGGLPGVGTTTLVRELARQLGAVHLPIDSIEQAIPDSGRVTQPRNNVGVSGRLRGGRDNLLLGRTVIAVSVNRLQLSRNAGVAVASRAGVGRVEVEVMCSDRQQHRWKHARPTSAD